MKSVFFVVIFVALQFSCHSNHESLFITTKTFLGSSFNESSKRDSIFEISSIQSDFFNITLTQLSEEPYYKGSKEIEKSMSLKDFKYVFCDITDELGETLKFKTAKEFINFMSKRGYKVIEQKETEFDVEFRFSRI